MIGTNHDIDVNQTDRYERTPLYCATLYCASENGHTEVVKVLLAQLHVKILM